MDDYLEIRMGYRRRASRCRLGGRPNRFFRTLVDFWCGVAEKIRNALWRLGVAVGLLTAWRLWRQVVVEADQITDHLLSGLDLAGTSDFGHRPSNSGHRNFPDRRTLVTGISPTAGFRSPDFPL
ncbi:hypothetical protein ACLB2K_023279 [Fragaria x ananassa]